MDIDSILDQRWVIADDLTPEEYERAVEFWQGIRRHDELLNDVREKAAVMIHGWTGCRPRDVGSFGTRMNLDSSDLDLGIYCTLEDRPALIAALDGHATFKAERDTRTTSTRLVFAFTVEGVEIDLSALTPEDFTADCRMLDQIEACMTREERIAHTCVKHRLRAAGRMEDYARWKLVVYAKYCPEFDWVPIPEHPATATAG